MDQIAIDQLLALTDLAIEGQIDADQLARLEHWVISDPQAAAVYANYVSVHAALRVSRGNPIPIASALNDSREMPFLPVPDAAQPSPNFKTTQGWGVGQYALLAIASVVCLMLGLWLASRGTSSTIAHLAETKGCRWDAGSLPTEQGASLTAGRLRLVEGLARIVFVNGVEVRLESPADFELVDPMKCIMRSGQLIARVPPNAKGFVVETPASVVTDFGTEFGVTVSKQQSAIVQVFEGRVDVYHPPTKSTEVMRAGRSLQFDKSSYGPHNHAEQSVSSETDIRSLRDNPVLQITTAQGRGRDAFVQPMEIPLDRQSQTLLLLKRPIERMKGWERRVYLGFDLSEVRKKRILDSELSLTFAPTGFGFASLLPDATFNVYGLIEESLDDWNEADLCWENAPACGLERKPLDEAMVQHLGSFVMLQGEQSATMTIAGEKLTQFLSSDTNQFATLIITRETEGLGSSDLVHGIASRRHPSLPPPTLRLQLQH